MNNPNIDISGWQASYAYKKFDTAFFTGYGDTEPTGCRQDQSGYYYCETAHTSSHSNSPTGNSSKWTQEFFFKPGYNAAATFEGKNYRTDFGEGYFSLLPKSTNNIHAQFNLTFDGRDDCETRAISNFLESHSFEPLSGAISGVTGFTFQSFYPYDKKDEYFCDGYEINPSFSNVNTVNATFANEHTSATDWMNRFISSGNTNGLWEVGKTYSLYDTVYHSGGILGSLSGSDGYYFYTGATSTTSTILNSPSGNNSLWTNDVFLFKPSVVSNEIIPIRFSNNRFGNDFNQRSNDGINTANLKLNVVLANRSNKEAVAISKFLLSKQAYQTFKFTPPQPHHKKLSFVCESWRHNYVFDDNHSFELKFEQNPLDLSKKSRAFKTLVVGENRQIYAPYDGTDFGFETYGPTTGVDFGDFMTGFASGTGMYIVNSGEQAIKSTLALSGDQAASGLFKLENPHDDRASNFTASGYTYKLAPGESGRFDITFSTTGHTGQIGENAGLGASASSDSADRISFSMGRVMYTNEPDVGGIKESALIVSTTDEFFFADPSGDLKTDLIGEAVHNEAPGAPVKVMAKAVRGRSAVTGSWELADSKTATGVSVLYSTDASNYTMFLTGLATGTTTFTHEPVSPLTTYHYKVGASNCDIVGVGTSIGRTFSTCAFHDNVALSAASPAVDVGELGLTVTIGARDAVYNQLNISTLVSGELDKLGLSNCNNFTGVTCVIKGGATVVSNDPEIPALQTGPLAQTTTGSDLKLRLVVENGAEILGAGGKGADAVRQEDLAFALSTTMNNPGSQLEPSQSRVGSVHELQGVGPVSLWAASGSVEGKYLLPNGKGGSNNITPFNGGSGGTAFAIHPSYRENNQEVEITNSYGRILGGGGGGGQGGARYNDLIADPDPLKSFVLSPAALKQRQSPESLAFEAGSQSTPSEPEIEFIQEIRPGGAGGGGAGVNKNTTNMVGIATNPGLTSRSDAVKFGAAAGGKGCRANAKYRKVNVETSTSSTKWGIQVARPSRNGGSSSIKFSTKGNIRSLTASEGGAGSCYNGNIPRGTLEVASYEKPKVIKGDGQELENNRGGAGGFGGGWGLDGGNGEHPQQSEQNRYQEPRNYGYGGSGGLSIQTNGCRVRFMVTGYSPSSGMGVYGGQRTDTDSKSSELYRNIVGIGNYLTARCSGSATAKEADDPNVLGLMSGLKNDGPNKANTETEAVGGGASGTWRAFNQRIHGTPSDYVELYDATNGFPYYLVYDFGEDKEQRVQSYTIASAGASPSHYSTEANAKIMLSDVYAPTTWEMQATNLNPSDFPNDSDWELLHRVRDNVPKQSLPVNLKTQDASTELNDKSYVSIPGLIRAFPINNLRKFRYYRLKIISAEHEADKKCKIADFGLRSSNRGYAGFISSPLHT